MSAFLSLNAGAILVFASLIGGDSHSSIGGGDASDEESGAIACRWCAIDGVGMNDDPSKGVSSTASESVSGFIEKNMLREHGTYPGYTMFNLEHDLHEILRREVFVTDVEINNMRRSRYLKREQRWRVGDTSYIGYTFQNGKIQIDIVWSDSDQKYKIEWCIAQAMNSL
jgi:hypothetical protein